MSIFISANAFCLKVFWSGDKIVRRLYPVASILTLPLITSFVSTPFAVRLYRARCPERKTSLEAEP